MRTWYEITQHFLYKDGTPGGILHTWVNSQKAVKEQLSIYAQWLTDHGHASVGEAIVVPCENPNKDRAT